MYPKCCLRSAKMNFTFGECDLIFTALLQYHAHKVYVGRHVVIIYDTVIYFFVHIR